MVSATEALALLTARGIRLFVEGGALFSQAMPGVITVELAAIIREHKPGILALLEEHGAPAQEKPKEEQPSPAPACRCCRTNSRRWRLSPRHPWVCCACHPPAPALRVEWEEVSRP